MVALRGIDVEGGERRMRVLEIERQDGQRRYVVMDEDGRLVKPIVRYLKYLDCVGSARETLRSYAYALKHYWEYLCAGYLVRPFSRMNVLTLAIRYLKPWTRLRPQFRIIQITVQIEAVPIRIIQITVLIRKDVSK